MIATVEQPVLLPADLHGAWALILAAAAAVAWVALHRLDPRGGKSVHSFRPVVVAVLRVGAGILTLVLAADAAQRVVVPVTPWPLWLLAIVGAIAVEAVVALYSLERRIAGGRGGTAATWLRIALVLIVVAMLAQPVLSTSRTDRRRRSVAILIDNSGSMHIRDTALTEAETVRLAEVVADMDVSRPYRLETVSERLSEIARELADLDETLSARMRAAGPDSDPLGDRGQALGETLQRMREDVAEQMDAVAEPIDGLLELDSDTQTSLADLRSRLAVQGRDRLEQAAEIADSGRTVADAPAEELIEAIRNAAGELEQSAGLSRRLADELDTAFYRSLSQQQQSRMRAAARARTRREQALAALNRRPDHDEGRRGTSLLNTIDHRYRVRAYQFGDDIEPASIAKLRIDDDALSQEEPPDDAGGTDIASALSRVAAEIPAEDLAGIILLTDGRHNTPGEPEEIAGRLGLGGVPVSSVVLGGRYPPRDAAVVGVEAPETIHESDKVQVTADLKLDGLAGRRVTVSLFSEGRLCDEKVVTPESREARMRVRLTDTPEQTGSVDYRVVVERFEQEAFAENNEYEFSVAVTDEPTKVLLLEGRPRWEFRYLRNLFTDRDPSVRLQYVLLQPDRVHGQDGTPVIPASVSRPEDSPGATATPESFEEWMKFDVVILGDVAPEMLSDADRRALEDFVSDMGKSLVVVAGPHHMPHAWSGTELADLMPVTFEALDDTAGAPEDAYRLELTDTGLDHPMMRQADDPESGAEIWRELPELHWRFPITEAKPAAKVLAYARTPDAPEAEGTGGQDYETSGGSSTRHQRRHALVAYHDTGMGRAMFMGFDRTWRLRYRAGDARHHRFWSQVVQWAGRQSLPVGVDFARLGTDRTRYAARTPVRVRARLLDAGDSPLVTDRVGVNLFDEDGKSVLRTGLHPLTGSPGTYAAEFEPPPGGVYRLELDAPAVQERLEAEGVEKVAMDISVDPAADREQIELKPDFSLARRMAEASGGVAVGAHLAERVTDVLGEPEIVRVQRRDYSLWDSWPALIIVIGVATAEWLIRKKEHLP